MSEVNVPRVSAPLESLEKASKGLPISGIALFVAQLMFEEAELVSTDTRVYKGGSRKALMSLFPTRSDAKAESTAKAVRPYLFRNGYSLFPGGGYKVPLVAPDASNWNEPEEATGNGRVQAESAEAEAKAKVLAGDIRKKWQCRLCDRKFDSQLGRGSHEGKTHRETFGGVPVSGAQFVLLKAISAKPWEHPRWYAAHLKQSRQSVTEMARKLRELGLVQVVGGSTNARYGPAAEGQEPTLVAVAQPELAVTDTSGPRPGGAGEWRATERYLSPEAAKALIAQIDERELRVATLLAEAEKLETESNSIRVALDSLLKMEAP